MSGEPPSLEAVGVLTADQTRCKAGPLASVAVGKPIPTTAGLPCRLRAYAAVATERARGLGAMSLRPTPP